MASGGSACVVKIWDMKRKEVVKNMKGHSHAISRLQHNFHDQVQITEFTAEIDGDLFYSYVCKYGPIAYSKIKY